MKPQAIYDVECYRDYFLITFRKVGSKEPRFFEMYEGQQLDIPTLNAVMEQYELIGFNSLNYDVVMVLAAMSGYSNARLHKLSTRIVTGGGKGWMVLKDENLYVPKQWSQIDLIESSPGVMVSLKSYAGRLGSKRMQDLPIPPDASIDVDQREELRTYCVNDLDVTEDLFNAIRPRLDLARVMTAEYGVDLMSKSDAQIAEAVLADALGGRTKRETKVKPFHYVDPGFIEFEAEHLQEFYQTVLDTQFELSSKGKTVLPKHLSKPVELNGRKYKFGIGGIHSQEKKQVVVPKENELLLDVDVASFYPNIILGQELKPTHLGDTFLTAYRSIVERRLKAKAEGDKSVANSLKIVINGLYGKFGSEYSFVFSPELLIQTTITGQLSLLMLIEMVESVGASVTSANTDGIVILCDKMDKPIIDVVIGEWEQQTQYVLEETPYLAMYSRDVNNYVAVKPCGEVKGKGDYGDVYLNSGVVEPDLKKNIARFICVEACWEYLGNGTPIEQTINNCDDTWKFLMMSKVAGGGVWRGQYLGKSVRWYYAHDGEEIRYQTNNNKVGRSDGCKPLMEINMLPKDIDYDRYINETIKMLNALGVTYA